MLGEGEQTWHNLQSADGDMTMGDGDDDTDDELVPGCYELDVDPNPVSDVDTIWIRAEGTECGCLIFSGHIFDCR